MEGRVDLGYPAMEWPVSNMWPLDHKSDTLTTMPSSHPTLVGGNDVKNTPLNGVRFTGVTCFEVAPWAWSVTDGRLEPPRSLVRRRRSTFLRDRLDLLLIVISICRSDSCLSSSPTVTIQYTELISTRNKDKIFQLSTSNGNFTLHGNANTVHGQRL